MKRTQIYLPDDLKNQISIIADGMGMSMGELIRTTMQDAVYTGALRRTQVSNMQKILDLKDKLKIKGGPKNLSSKVDYYLYEE